MEKNKDNFSYVRGGKKNIDQFLREKRQANKKRHEEWKRKRSR